MAISNIKIEFPCGLKIEVYIRSIFLSEVNTFTDIKECPLHGKNCPKKKDLK